MSPHKPDRLFAPDKVEWMLEGGLETMEASELQILLVMAETKLQEGYKPQAGEKKAVDKLRALMGEDARELKRQVKAMVKGRKLTDAGGITLPPVFDRLRKRLGKEPSQE